MKYPLRIFIIAFAVLLSSCSPRYWDRLPESRSGVMAYHDREDKTATRATVIARRLTMALPLPVERVHVITGNFATQKFGREIVKPNNASAARCGKGDPPPYGCILIGDDLLNAISDDAITGILAHEIGHLECGHRGSKDVENAIGAANIGSAITHGARVVPGAAGLVIWGVGMAAHFIGKSMASDTASLSRDVEREADASAVRRLHSAGYCAGPLMRKTFDEIQNFNPKSGQGGIYSTHPDYQERWGNAGNNCGPM